MLKAEMTDHLGYEKNAKEGDAPIHTYKENQSEFSISKVHLVILCV
jgi:hypothetical protein